MDMQVIQPNIRENIINELLEFNLLHSSSLASSNATWKLVVLENIHQRNGEYRMQDIIDVLQEKEMQQSYTPYPLLELIAFIKKLKEVSLQQLEIDILKNKLVERERELDA